MLPTLIVCHNLTQTAKPQVKEFFRKSIFPDSSKASVFSESVELDKETRFFFKHLTFFLTCLDTNVKRYAGEWLFLLCNQNGELGGRRAVCCSGL